jgi:CRP/FNR family transcriptional regulator
LERGYIKRYFITKEGNKSIQVIYGPNYIFPLTPIFEVTHGLKAYRGPEVYYYEALTDVVTYSLSLDNFQEMAAKQPTLYKDLLFAAGLRLNSYIHRLEDQSLHSSLRRVAHQLVYLADRFGTAKNGAVTLQLPLTHQVLADILDLSRETVSREMAKLKSRGLIDNSDAITIGDIQKLRSLYS